MATNTWKGDALIYNIVPTLTRVSYPKLPSDKGYNRISTSGFRYEYVSYKPISRNSTSLAIQDRPSYGSIRSVSTKNGLCTQCGGAICVPSDNSDDKVCYEPNIQHAIIYPEWNPNNRGNCTCTRIPVATTKTSETANGCISYSSFFNSRCISFDSAAYGRRVPVISYNGDIRSSTEFESRGCKGECQTITYKPNNSAFAVQGAVGSSSQIRRKGDLTRSVNAQASASAYGLYASNFGRFSESSPGQFYIHNAAPTCVRNVWLSGSRRLYSTRVINEKEFDVEFIGAAEPHIYDTSFNIGSQTIYNAFTPTDFMEASNTDRYFELDGREIEGESAGVWGGLFNGAVNLTGFVFTCQRDPSITVIVFLGFTNTTGDISNCDSENCAFRLEVKYHGYRSNLVGLLNADDVLTTKIGPVYTKWESDIYGQIKQPAQPTSFELSLRVVSAP